MTFFDPTPAPEHHCPIPTGFSYHCGWRCDCGKAYIKELLPFWEVQPGQPNWQWVRAPEHDVS